MAVKCVTRKQYPCGTRDESDHCTAAIDSYSLCVEARLADNKRELKQLSEVCCDSNAVCVCGCPASEHETVGPEEGEQCEHEDHVCIRTSPAVAKIVADLRAEVSGLIYDRD